MANPLSNYIPARITEAPLPQDLFTSILSSPELGITEVAACSLVCRQWNRFSKGNYLWRLLLARDFGMTLDLTEKTDDAYKVYQRKFLTCKNIKNGKCIFKVFRDSEDLVNSCVFSRVKSQIITAGSLGSLHDNKIKVLNLKTRECERKFNNFSTIFSIKPLNTKNHLLVFFNSIKMIQSLNLDTGERIEISQSQRPSYSILSRDDAHLALAFSSAHEGSKHPFPIKIVNLNDNRFNKLLEGHQKPIIEMTFDAKGSQIISSSKDGKIKIWDITTGNTLNALDHHGKIPASYVLKENLLFSATIEGTIHSWDLKDGKHLMSLNSDKPVFLIKISRNCKQLLLDSFGQITRWNLDTLECTGRLENTAGPTLTLVLTEDGNCLISAHENSSICFWDSKSLELLHTIKDSPLTGWSENKLLTLDPNPMVFSVVDFDPKDNEPQEQFADS